MGIDRNKVIAEEILIRGGYEALNDMQKAVLESDSHKILLLSPTGTGKTVAFTIFILKHIKRPKGRLQTLVVTPSRELARQVTSVIKTLAQGYRIVTLTGGHSLKDELNAMAGDAPDIIIATPGRLLDHLQRNTIDFRTVKVTVIDEMDKCLELGFLPDIKKILRKISFSGYFMLTSATMPSEKEALDITENFKLLNFTDAGKNNPNVEIVEVPSFEKDKVNVLNSLLNTFDASAKTIVFVNYRESAERLHNLLSKRGFPVALYHGALEQQNRELAIAGLRGGATPILIATDLASRGLDIPEVENVVHYHIPVSEEAYIHRNGRTARAGAEGTVYVIKGEDENTPDYMIFDRRFNPPARNDAAVNGNSTGLVVFNIGKKDKISKGDIVGFLTKQLGIDGKNIGRIDIGDYYSSVNLPKGDVPVVMAASKGGKIKNKRFKVSLFE